MSEILRSSLARTGMASAAALLALAGCGSDPTEYQDVSVNGWDVTQEATIFTQAWVEHTDADDLPDDDRAIRNVDDYPVKSGSVCIAYNEYGSCTASIPLYETHYDYESFDTVVARACLQQPIFSEFADPKISKDGSCWDQRNGEEWRVENDPKYVVRVRFTNEDDEIQECTTTVDKDMYYRTSQERHGLTAVIDDGCWVVKLAYPEPEK